MADLPDEVPGLHGNIVECIVKRDKTKSKFKLFLDVGPPAAMKEDKFLLAARKVRGATGTDYIISSNADDMSRGSSDTNIIGRLSSNFQNTAFKIYHTQPPHNGKVSSTNRISGSHTNQNVAHDVVAYNPRIPGHPYSMDCTLHSIPISAMDLNGSAPTSTQVSARTYNVDDSIPLPGLLRSKQSKSAVADCSVTTSGLLSPLLSRGGPLVLKSVTPQWRPKNGYYWVLNFRRRVSVGSMKNAQLVAATEPNQRPSPTKDNDKILLQFGKIGEDSFTVDYRYPLSPFQAFAIFLSRVDNKWGLTDLNIFDMFRTDKEPGS